MKYLHSTIQNSQKILQYIRLESSRPDIAEVVLVYSNYVQLLHIDSSNQEIQVSKGESYPLGVEISRIVSIGSHFAVITTNGYLMMVENRPPFKRVSLHQLLDESDVTNSPDEIPIAHVATSQAGEYVITAAYSKFFVSIAFDSSDLPTFKRWKLHDGCILLSLAPTHNPEIFLGLIYIKGKGKFIVNITPAGRMSKLIEVEPNAREIVSVVLESQYIRILLFTDDAVFIDTVDYDDSQPPQFAKVPLSSPMCANFQSFQGELVFQILDGNIYVYDSQKTFLTRRGNLPVLSHFIPLENNTIFCVCEHGDTFIIPVSHNSSMTQNTAGFELYPRMPVPMTPLLTHASFVGNEMYVCTGRGSSSQLLTIKNSLPFAIDDIPLNGIEFVKGNGPKEIEQSKFPNERLRLFEAAGTIILSSNQTTMKLYGDAPTGTAFTIATGSFYGEYVHITQREIIALSSGQRWAPTADIIAADIVDDCIIIVCSDSSVTVFGQNLEPLKTDRIENARHVAFCNDELVAFAQDGDKGSSLVTLYQRDLEPTDGVVQLAAPVTSLVFQQELNGLFVGIKSGNVMKFTIDSLNFSGTCETIYNGNVPPSIFPFMRTAIIVSDGVYLFENDEMLVLSLPKPIVSLGVSSDSSLLVLTNEGDLQKVTITDPSTDITQNFLKLDLMPRRVLEADGYAIVICREGVIPECRSQLISINTETKDMNSENFEPGAEVLTVCSIGEGLIALSVRKRHPEQPEKGYGNFIEIRRVDSLELVQSFIPGGRAPILALAVNDGLLYFGWGEQLVTTPLDSLGERDKFQRVAVLSSRITHIAFSEGTTWVGTKDESVFALQPQVAKGTDKRNDNFAIFKSAAFPKFMELPVAADTVPRQITAMSLIDDTTIAVGDRFGNIVILQLPDDVAYQKMWRVSMIPDRKLPQPCERLVRIASYSVSEMVTSILISPRSNAIFYTTLLGQVGALIPMASEDEYSTLVSVENQTERACSSEFGLMLPRAIESGRMCVANSDMISMLPLLQQETQARIETGLKVHREWVLGLVCRARTAAKF